MRIYAESGQPEPKRVTAADAKAGVLYREPNREHEVWSRLSASTFLILSLTDMTTRTFACPPDWKLEALPIGRRIVFEQTTN